MKSQDIDRGLSPSDSHSHRNHRKREFNLEFFFEKFRYDQIRDTIQKAADKYKVKINTDKKKQIPDLEGVAIIIEGAGDERIKDKCEAAHEIFKIIEVQGNLDIIMLIPEGIVSYLIGAGGGQITKFSKDSKANIVVNQPIQNFQPRTVKLTGTAEQIYEAIKLMSKKILERGVTDDDYNQVPKPVDPSKIDTRVRLAYETQVLDYLDKYLEEYSKKYDIQIKIRDSHKIKGFRKEDRILQLDGKLKHIQQALKSIMKRAHSIQNDNPFKIVMPASYASKLIGAKGCLIRDIANKAGGANIKVLSDKQTDSDAECLVEIKGNVSCTYDACMQILEQIECFRNGGPILESGRYINENFANQYRNSVQQQRESRSRSSSKRRRKKISISTTLIVPTSVINQLEEKIKEYGSKYRVQYNISDNRHSRDSNLQISGTCSDCVAFIELILKDQSKILRK
ncbi:hypothetical protein pb186bvf_006972 [Paramecium bursaria]